MNLSGRIRRSDDRWKQIPVDSRPGDRIVIPGTFINVRQQGSAGVARLGRHHPAETGTQPVFRLQRIPSALQGFGVVQSDPSKRCRSEPGYRRRTQASENLGAENGLHVGGLVARA